MKQNLSKRILSVLVALVMVLSMLPATANHVHAWDDYVECEYCGEGCGDDYICSGGSHCSSDSGRSCYDEHHCADCGDCVDDPEELCDMCGYICDDCAVSCGYHCSDCKQCEAEVTICEECGKCEDCAGWCENCQLCLECAFNAGELCWKMGVSFRWHDG